MTSFKEVIQDISTAQKFIAYCDTSIPRKLLSNEYISHKDTIILIGPEGDFSIDEVRLAVENGYESVSLGTSRLRTETAGLVAVHMAHIARRI